MIERHKETGKEVKIVRSRQSAECGGNQDVRYQERSEMTLDYTKLFRWQETSSQGSFHMCGDDGRFFASFFKGVIFFAEAKGGVIPPSFCFEW